MGAGLAIFVLLIFIFIPIFIVSVAYLLIYKKASDKELSNLKFPSIRAQSAAQSAKARLYRFYGIVLILFYFGFWLKPLVLMISGEPGIIHHFLRGIMSWDSLGDIVVYWSVLLGIFLFSYIIESCKKNNIRLYDTNKYIASVYLVGLYPFILISFIGWAGSWEPQKRFYKSDDILANFGYSNNAIEKQLGAERVAMLQSIMSWADTYEIPYEWLPRNILKLDTVERLMFHSCPKYPLRLPETLGELNKLRGIGIIQCSLQTVPDSIIQLKQLHGLVLRRNNIQELPDGLSQLQNLTVLDIRANNLHSISEDIGGLVRLTELKLSGNKIPILPNSLSKLKDLTTLYVAQNKLTELPDCIGNFPKLRRLDISNNQITHIPDTVLDLLRKKQLKYFDYSGNQFSEEELKRIEDSIDDSFTLQYWNKSY